MWPFKKPAYDPALLHSFIGNQKLILDLLGKQNINQLKTMADLTKLTAAVADLTTATNAAVAALGKPDTSQADVDVLTAQVETNTNALKTATPAPAA